jgi:phosphomannomutase
MKPLKIGIVGIRGIVGETFTPELAVSFAQAFATYLNSGRILICRDTRPSGPMVSAAVAAGLLASGCEVIDLGVCPTPSLQLAIPWLNAQGGIAITAGHNATPWNALKFIRADGHYLNASQATELLDLYHQHEFEKAPWDRIRPMIDRGDAVDHHLAILARSFDTASIRKRAFRVAVDCCNGACSVLAPRWITELGGQVLTINDDMSAPFPHDPEPRKDTMAQVRAVVKAGGADIGFVLDAVAARVGCPVYRTPIGEANVAKAMQRHKAVIGGEGNGGVIYPPINFARDSLVGMALILHLLAESGQSVSQLVEELPAFFMVKRRLPFPSHRIADMLARVRREYAAYPIDVRDGVKVTLATRIASSYVVAIPSTDWAVFVAVPLVLGAVILLACYVPARRAARVDPMVALREL